MRVFDFKTFYMNQLDPKKEKKGLPNLALTRALFHNQTN